MNSAAVSLDDRLVVAERVVKAILPSALAGLALGVGLWWAFHQGQSGYYATNKLPIEDRHVAFVYCLASGLVASLMHVLVAVSRVRAGSLHWLSSLESIARGGRTFQFLACSVPFLVFCTAPGVEAKRPGALTLAIVLASLFVGYGLSRWSWFQTGGETADTGLWAVLHRWLPRVVVVGACGLYANYLSLGSIAIHRRLLSHLDLAVYENVLWNTSHGNFLGCTICKGGTHASSHFDPILALLAPIYRLFPQTNTLFVAQSLWLAAGAIPLYALAQRQLKSSWISAVIAVCFLLSPAMHGANLFGFHSLVLCTPFVLCAVYCLEAGRRRGYWLSLALLLLVREDMALVACGMGAYAYFSDRRRLGLATVGVAVLYLLTVKLWAMGDSGLIMQNSSKTVSFAHYFKQLVPHKSEGGLGLLKSLVTNPSYVLVVVLREVKLRYWALLLAPLMGLSLLSPRRLWFCAWGLFFVSLATRDAVFSPHFQYSLLIVPGLFAALPAGILRLSRLCASAPEARRAVQGGAAMACLLASLLMAAKFGALHRNQALRGGWEKPVWSLDLKGNGRYQSIRRLGERIPPDATLAATRGLLAYVAGREKLSKGLDTAEYVLIDTKRFPKNAKRAWKRARTKWNYSRLERSQGLELYRRGEPREGALR